MDKSHLVSPVPSAGIQTAQTTVKKYLQVRPHQKRHTALPVQDLWEDLHRNHWHGLPSLPPLYADYLGMSCSFSRA